MSDAVLTGQRTHAHAIAVKFNLPASRSVAKQLRWKLWRRSQKPNGHPALRGTELDLTGRDVGVSGGASVLEWLCNPEANSVTGVDLSGSDLSAGGTTLVFWLELDSVLSLRCPARSGLTNLCILNLSGTNMGDEGFLILVEGLVKCEALEELGLAENRLTSVSTTGLVSILKKCERLQRLDLSRNLLSKVRERCPALHTLSRAQCVHARALPWLLSSWISASASAGMRVRARF